MEHDIHSFENFNYEDSSNANRLLIHNLISSTMFFTIFTYCF
jgi:hypothetical protein